MKRIIIYLILVQCATNLFAQKTEVLTLGTFHFAFYNRDVAKIAKKDQINVLSPKYQDEIEQIVEKIAKFKPTIIAIEVDPKYQKRVDSMYNEYLNGTYELGRSEDQQIGFRLAKQMGIKKLHCVNDWGVYPKEIDAFLNGKDSTAQKDFFNYFYHNPDSLLRYDRKNVFKSEGILKELINCNKSENLTNSLGNYLIGVFKYETPDNEFFGVDFTTGWWFNRNLRIYKNIQKIQTTPSDRILVIYGCGHMNILNPLFEASPEYELKDVTDYLK